MEQEEFMDFQTDLHGMHNFLLTKSTKKMLEDETTDFNQKRKTKKVNWTEIRVVHLDRAFLLTMLYKYNLDVSWQTVDIGQEKVRLIKNITCCSLM